MFDSLLAWLHVMGASINDPLVLFVLAASAAIEYIFPPFPGDAITLLGAVLVSIYHWNLVLVFCALLAGSLVGSLSAYVVGRRWRLRRAKTVIDETGQLAALVAHFRRRGSWYLLVNRFVPGIRPLFFVAAGLACMHPGRVLVMSAISGALWISLLMLAGSILGHNIKQLQAWLNTYSTVAIILLITAAILVALRHLRLRSQRRAAALARETPDKQ